MAIRNNILLLPLAMIYGLITRVRNLLYDYGILSSAGFNIPVICVGNITVGGTGKTPHVEYIADLLRREFRIAVLSRGYKRKSKDFQFADITATSETVGDEPLQIANKYPEVVVAVDRDRVAGVKMLMDVIPETQAIILDDGFQHRSIIPGFTILLTDYNRPMMNDFLLPYGRLRESVTAKRRADIIIVTKMPPELSPIDKRLIMKNIDKEPYQHLFFTSIKYMDLMPVFPGTDKNLKPTLNDNSAAEVLLVTGIANAEPLKKYVEKYFPKLKHLCYPDHHRFTTVDIEKITKEYNSLQSPVKYIITTEKDSVRLKEFTNIAASLKELFWFVPVGIEFKYDQKKEFDNLILDYVRKNKRNNRISER